MRPQVRPLITSVATFAALLCIASCSKDVATQPGSAIQQSYEMEYEVARNRTTGRASFRANDSSGAQVQLAPPAAILYNAIPMSWNNAEPFGYTRLQPGRLESGIFEYTDASGIVRTNVATLSSVETIALPASVNELIMSSQADIVWQGAAVGSSEMVHSYLTPRRTALPRSSSRHPAQRPSRSRQPIWHNSAPARQRGASSVSDTSICRPTHRRADASA